MSVLLLNHMGTPEPSPEIQRRLRGVNPLLHLRYLPGGGSWAICFQWRDDDPRRERIQRRDLDPDKAYDIVGYLPMNCPVDEAPAYLERSLRTFPREDIQRMVQDVAQYNATAPLAQAAEQALSEVLDQRDPTGLSSTFASAMRRGPGRPRKVG